MVAIGSILILLGLPTSIGDIWMNGARYAEWAPYGLILSFTGLVLVYLA